MRSCAAPGSTFHIEDVQDQVGSLMRASGATWRASMCSIARTCPRARPGKPVATREQGAAVVENGQRKALDLAALDQLLASACEVLRPRLAGGNPRKHAARPVRRRADGGGANPRSLAR
jgi:hypothetical protein